MKLAPCVLLLGLMAGCANTTTPIYDTRFGDAVRDSRQRMAIDPEAGRNTDPAVGLDGKAARESMLNYQSTYKTPPPAINVINIGGSIGSR